MRITLWDVENENGRFHLEARVNEDGHLVLAGHDLGPVVESVWGDRDHEYWISLAPDHKERALSTLVRAHFSGPEELGGWLDDLGVPHRAPDEPSAGWEPLSKSGAGRRVLVEAPTRDRVLLSLLGRLHRQRVFSLERTFPSWLKEKGIPHRFSSYA